MRTTRCSWSCRSVSTDVRILRFQATGFRNLAPEVVEADAPVTVWWGGNGQGKTNLLEAVALLGALRSFRTAKLAECVALGSNSAEIDAAVEADGVLRRQAFRLGPGGRTLREDGRNIDALHWLRGLRAVWFAPTDTAVVHGEPALRRALVERACLTVAPAYLALGQHLRRVLEQRGAALRTRVDEDTLVALDAAFVDIARRVTAARAATVQAMAAAFSKAYEELSGGESASVAYRPWLTPERGEFSAWLHAHRPAERAAGRCLGGPQMDELVLTVAGRPARTCASRGQARSLVLAWKLAELQAARTGGDAPLFLMDDLGSELDAARTERLVGMVRALGSQVFVTTTDPRHVPDLGGEVRAFQVEAGRVRPG